MSLQHWNRLFEQANEDAQADLWKASIQTVAAFVLAKKNIVPETTYEMDEDYETEREGLIGNWLADSLPRIHTLIRWLDGAEFFEGNGLAWDETICLSGQACPCIDDVYRSLHVSSYSARANDYDITKEMVEDFYSHWRNGFFRRIAKELNVACSDSQK